MFKYIWTMIIKHSLGDMLHLISMQPFLYIAEKKLEKEWLFQRAKLFENIFKYSEMSLSINDKHW